MWKKEDFLWNKGLESLTLGKENSVEGPFVSPVGVSGEEIVGWRVFATPSGVENVGRK